jgi:tetratricopeptide (TPR) repeat protein
MLMNLCRSLPKVVDELPVGPSRVLRGLASLLLACCTAGCLLPQPPVNSDINALAIAQLGEEDVEETQTDVDQADTAQVYYETAKRFQEIGDLQNATQNYRKAIELLPRHFEARYQLAQVLALVGESEEAIQLLKSALVDLEREPQTRQFRRIREQAEMALLELDEIGLALAEAAFVLTDYAKSAEDADRFENALELYRTALRIWPACREARQRSRDLCEKQGLPLLAEQQDAANSTEGVYLDLAEITPKSSTLKTGALRINETKWGLPIYNRGTVYERGLWAPAPSRIEYALEGGFSRLTAAGLVSSFKGSKQQIAVLEKELGKPKAGTVVFTVSGDGKLLYTSETVTYESGPTEIDVDVTGVRSLVLEVLDADGTDLLDFAVWTDGRLYLKQ